MVVIGGGSAGCSAALRASRLGADVTLVEKGAIGGVCMNEGCIPTKALLQTSRLARQIRGAAEFGVDAAVGGVSWEAAVRRKDRVVRNLTLGLASLLEKSGVRVVRGRAEAVSPNLVEVTSEGGVQAVECDRLVLATGALPFTPPIAGTDLGGVIDSTAALALDRIPDSLVIIGAGVVGLEMASIFNGAGSKVTVIDVIDRILPAADPEAAEQLMKYLKRQGITFRLSSQVRSIERRGVALEVEFERGGKAQIAVGDYVLMATGRRANTSSFGKLDIALEGGCVKVDAHMRTNVEDVYAAGDVTGEPMLAHLAFAQGRCAAENALGVGSELDMRAVPSCLYTSPEYASVGLTEEDATALGLDVVTGSFPLRQNGRALTLGEREGFAKVVADVSGTVVGAQVLAAEASELIGEMALAVQAQLGIDDITSTIHAHPTLSETMWEASLDALGMPFHKG